MQLQPSIVCFKFKQGGGSERYVLDLIYGFKQNNITPIVYSTSFANSLPEYHWITPKKASTQFIPKKLRLPFLSKFIQQQKQPNEVILSMTHTYSDITICGGNHKGYLQALAKAPTLLEKFKIWNEQKAFDNAKMIVAHSELMKRELIALYQQPPEKIHVIYPPADTQKFKVADEAHRISIKQKLGFNTEDILYLFPSTGHTRKGYNLLKKYFNQSDLPIKLVVAGTPVKESRNIISLGFCDNMQELYQACDFTIMASTYEPFGLVGIESILCGTPVIFSENMACVETFQHNFGYTFAKSNIASLDNAIQHSITRVHSDNPRINDPLSALTYNPTLTHHIQTLQNLINEVYRQREDQ